MKGNLKRLLILCGTATVCAAVLRFIQLEFMTEPTTGFFYREYETFATVISVIILAVCVIVTVASAAVGKQPRMDAPQNKIFALGNFLMAAAVVYESLFSKVGEVVPSWQVLSQMVLGLVCAVLFFFHGLSAFRDIKIPPMSDIAFVAFWLIRVMVVFSNYVSVSAIAENVYELAALCTSLVFFLNAAKMRNGVKQDNNYPALLALTALAFICCFTYSVPQIVYMIVNGVSAHNGSAAGFTDLALSFYLTGFAVRFFAKDKTAKQSGQAEQLSMFSDGEESPSQLEEETRDYDSEFVFDIEPEDGEDTPAVSDDTYNKEE